MVNNLRNIYDHLLLYLLAPLLPKHTELLENRYQLRESKMTVAESLERSVEVAACRVSSLEDSNGQQAPQTTHRVDRNNMSRVF